MADGRRTSLLGLGCVAAVLVFGMGLLVFLYLGASEDLPSTGAGDGRTVVVIAVDDLRRDHLAFHGYRLDPTPSLTKLARAGVVARDYVPASTATGPSLAAILTGLGPLETGFTSARALGAHRLPRAVSTLAEEFAEAGWKTAAAFALPQDADRLTGLARGFGDVLGAPVDGPPLGAPAAMSGIVEMARGIDGDDALFAFLHLGDLRADDEPKLDDARLARWLARHFAPFRAGDTEIARELERLEETAGASAGDIAALVGRRRGSPAWLALQEARYDARLEALDAALGDLLRELAALGRDAPLVMVVGTRGRLLGVEPPADGPPIALSEALLATTWIVSGPGLVDAAMPLAESLRVGVLGREPSPASGLPTSVAAPGLAATARVLPEHKLVFRLEGMSTWYARATDLPGGMPDVTTFADEDVGVDAWELALAPPDGAELFLRVGSAGGDLLAVTGDADEILAPPSRKSADVRARAAATVTLHSATGREPFTLTLRGAGSDLTLAGQGPGERGAEEPLVSHLVPVLPASPVDGVDAAVVLAADGAWTRVRVAGLGPVELALWLTPPNDTAQAPQLEVVSGDARVETFPGLDAARVHGPGPLELRVRRGGGQSVAVAARIDGLTIPPFELSSDKGGDPATLALFLPPVDVGAFDVRLPNGDTILRARGRAIGLPMEPPYALSEKEARFLTRLGPLE